MGTMVNVSGLPGGWTIVGYSYATAKYQLQQESITVEKFESDFVTSLAATGVVLTDPYVSPATTPNTSTSADLLTPFDDPLESSESDLAGS